MNKLTFFLCLLPSFLFAQKQTLSHQDLVNWSRIEKTQISDDGHYVVYEVKQEKGDGNLNIYNTQSQIRHTFSRGEKAQISADGRFVVFMIKPYQDSLKAMKLRKVKKKDLPADTLAIYELATNDLLKIPEVENYKLPEKNANTLSYLHKPEGQKKKRKTADKGIGLLKPEPKKKDSKKKKENKENGAKLTVRNLDTGNEANFGYVTDYAIAQEGGRTIFYTTSDDTTYLAGVYIYDMSEGKNYEVHTDTTYGSHQKLTLSKDGEYAAFVAEAEAEDPRLHPFDLFVWKGGEMKKIDGETASNSKRNSASFMPNGFKISPYYRPVFSDNNERLLFGVTKQLPLKDTTILDEDRAKVEVWASIDKKLYTQQNVDVDKDKKRSYVAAFYLQKDEIKMLSDETMPRLRMSKDKVKQYALAYDETPYLRQASWEGFPVRKDVYIVNTFSGEKTKIATGLKAEPRLSAAATTLTWYNLADSTWNAYHIPTAAHKILTNNDLGAFYDELNDRPMQPFDYRSMGWLEQDAYFYIYDRYDIWKTTPTGKTAAVRLTKGREQKRVYRYVKLDPDKEFFEKNEEILLHVFDEKTKGSGYALLNISTGKMKELIFDDNLYYSPYPKKAKNTDKYIFTRENFQTFPNLQLAEGLFKNTQQITDVNPQQKNYHWGKAEAYTWTAYDGQQMEGVIVKPDNFDPTKKYPMIVNFYERSSHRLNRHRAPYPHRSTINYSFYASKGYVIFNPDVSYKIGHPGESAYNSVIAGVESLIEQGFIDKDRIGAQGHSWGGYQVAHLATKTDIFACIESGAPVVNMTSAYGGIRWGTGRSRMFQYEHTQSRIGGTLWNSFDLYKENSPLFNTDKINTPILIMHNDKDGAVPWYQGIEWFVALRRLNKPAWLLNYNDEPHWPLKLPNRIDFNVRMQQFFDHYLMGAEMPDWMKEGDPAYLKP